jgi:hypothetical protein
MRLRKWMSLSLPVVCVLSTAAAHAVSSYGTVGLPGVVVGYAFSVNQQLGLRVDAGTPGSIPKNGTYDGVDFNGTATYNRVGLVGDYFPFSGGFRFTGGLTINKASLDLKSHFDGTTSVDINGHVVTPSASDYFNVTVKFPTVMPYLGLGWGHDERQKGLGFVADVGVSFGRASLSRDTNLVGQYGITNADVDAKLNTVRDSIGQLTWLPSASLGLSYRY